MYRIIFFTLLKNSYLISCFNVYFKRNFSKNDIKNLRSTTIVNGGTCFELSFLTAVKNYFYLFFVVM